MPPAPRPSTARRPQPLVLGWILAQAAVITGGQVLRPGYVLSNDSVAVPQQDLLPWMLGADGSVPRAVPQDALVAVIDNVVPGWLVQSALVLAGLVLLGLGVARLLPPARAFDQAAAATVAMWSVYVFERSLMGHWGLLLGLAALPWVLDTAADVRRGLPGAPTRLLGWALVGSVVPTAGVLQVVAAGCVLAWPPVRHVRSAAGGWAGVVALQLVWILPGLRAAPVGSEAAADVFGLRAEGPGGPLLTALGTGGIWNASVVPGSREGILAVVAPVVLLLLGAWGVPRLGVVRAAVLRALLALGLIGLGWALLTAWPAAAPLVTRVEALPGGGLLRDAHKWIAPWVVLLALAVATGLGRLRDRLRGGDALGPVSVVMLLLPVLLLPDLAFGALGRLRPVTYPSEWTAVRTHLAASQRPGDVVSLPWSTFRAYSWNDRRTVLDPAPRFLPRQVVTDSRLLVQRADELVVVPSDDPRSLRVAAALLSADPEQGLAEQGIGWVLWQDGQPATPGYPSDPPDWLQTAGRTVFDGRGLTLMELRTLPERSPDQGYDIGLIVVWSVWLLVPLWLLRAALAHCLRRLAGTRSLPSRGSATVRPDE